jgi:hypothetical protein
MVLDITPAIFVIASLALIAWGIIKVAPDMLERHPEK